MDTAYADRVLPDSTLAGYDISGMSAVQVDAILIQAENGISVGLTADGTTKRATGTELGIAVDRETILSFLSQQSKAPFWIYHNRHTDVPLSVSIDKYQFNSWLNENFPGTFTPAVDAGLLYDPATGLFSVTSSAPGTGVSSADLASITDILPAQSGKGSFTLGSTEPIPASISDDQAASAEEWANERLSAKCSFTYEGKTLYTLTKANIASLIATTPNLDGLTARVDPVQVHDFIEGTLASAVGVPPIPQKLVTDDQGNAINVVQPGATGRALGDVDALSDQIIACLNSAASSQIEITFTDVPYTTEASKPSPAAPPPGSEAKHWADVNLTTQTVTLMNGATPGSTFILSSGAPSHPTPTGIFNVYAKVKSQSLSGCADGDCYYYPDVHWATWFYQDFGFHTAYWHNDFGTPVSHGCLNLHEEDAKAVFDWLSIGDAVDVH